MDLLLLPQQPTAPTTAQDALARLSHDPLGYLRPVLAASTPAAAESLARDAARAHEAATTREGKDAALDLHAALAAWRSSSTRGKGRRRAGGSESDEEEDEEGEEGGPAGGNDNATVLHLLWGHTRESPTPRALRTAQRTAAFLLGRDAPRALSYLKAWAAADPTSDAALSGLVAAYRRQLLRSYVRVHVCTSTSIVSSNHHPL